MIDMINKTLISEMGLYTKYHQRMRMVGVERDI